jgi:excinuclease UvrABC ATPase subunit
MLENIMTTDKNLPEKDLLISDIVKLTYDANQEFVDMLYTMTEDQLDALLDEIIEENKSNLDKTLEELKQKGYVSVSWNDDIQDYTISLTEEGKKFVESNLPEDERNSTNE